MGLFLNKCGVVSAIFIFLSAYSHAAEPKSREFINSEYYNYYEHLVIMGKAERPVLIYHSFSNSTWNLSRAGNNHVWSERMNSADTMQNDGSMTIKTVDPDLYNSYNSAYPHGINDGALWQGRGYNSRLTGGGIFSYSGISIFIVPEIHFSQNRNFDIMTPGNGEYSYINIGYLRGNTTGLPNIDYPQRFGNDPISRLTWGQSSIRFNAGIFTAGISTENIKLGPAKINPLILSSNASGFPHADMGITMWNTSVGKFEGRLLWGILYESDYFDDIKSNNRRIISLISLAYAPSIIQGLIFGVNRCAMVVSEDHNTEYWSTFFNPVFTNGDYGSDKIDQRASLTVEWLLPASNFTVYLEWAREDHNKKIQNVIRAPEHSNAYTAGFSKSIPGPDNNFFILSFELTQLIWSRNYEISQGTGGSFYTHHIVTQGHTHEGQILGAGIGPGADSQHLSLDYYFTDGKLGIFVFRHNRNNDPLYHDPITYSEADADPELESGITRVNVEINLGITGMLFIGDVDIYYLMSYGLNLNRDYIQSNYVSNFHGEISLRYRL